MNSLSSVDKACVRLECIESSFYRLTVDVPLELGGGMGFVRRTVHLHLEKKWVNIMIKYWVSINMCQINIFK